MLIGSTYHFIRTPSDKKYNKLNFFSVSKFYQQINFFLKNYNIIDENILLDLIENKIRSRKKFLFLSFDDGYSEHYHYVYKYLKKKKIKGFFYPITRTLVDSKYMTLTNKIHFIIARVEQIGKIFELSELYLKKYSEYKFDKILRSAKKIHYSKRRFDNKKIVLVKNFLNFSVPENIRNKLISFIFKKIVSNDIIDFSKEIYLNKNQIYEMGLDGMHFGTHTHSHIWLGNSSMQVQLSEISKSINILKSIIKNNKLSICYPFGSYNKDTIKISKQFNLLFGLSNTFGRIKNNTKISKFEIPRFDCKDF